MTVASTIERFLAEDLALGEGGSIAADKELLEQGLLDSAGIAQVMVFLEESFAIELDDADLVPENFQTIEAMSALVARKSG